MGEEKNRFTQSAMFSGTLLGLIWIIKFPMYITGLTHPMLSLLFLFLTFASPFLAGYLTLRYRKRERGGELTFLQAWGYLLLLYLCASMLVAIVHFLYFNYFDHNYLLPYIQEQFQLLLSQNQVPKENLEETEKAFTSLTHLSPRDITIQLFLSNLFFASFIAPLTALFVYKRRTI